MARTKRVPRLICMLTVCLVSLSLLSTGALGSTDPILSALQGASAIAAGGAEAQSSGWKMLSASKEWCYRAFLGGASRQLYLASGAGKDGEKILHKGRFTMRERKYRYDMTVRRTMDGGTLVLSVPVLRLLIENRCHAIDLHNGLDSTQAITIDLDELVEQIKGLGLYETEALVLFEVHADASWLPFVVEDESGMTYIPFEMALDESARTTPQPTAEPPAQEEWTEAPLAEETAEESAGDLSDPTGETDEFVFEEWFEGEGDPIYDDPFADPEELSVGPEHFDGTP